MSTNDTPTDPVLIARIRAARGYANLTQAGLAERLGVSPGLTKRIERGERPLTTAELADIADVCGVPRGFLLNGFQTAPDERLDALAARMEALEASVEARVMSALETALATTEAPQEKP